MSPHAEKNQDIVVEHDASQQGVKSQGVKVQGTKVQGFKLQGTKSQGAPTGKVFVATSVGVFAVMILFIGGYMALNGNLCPPICGPLDPQPPAGQTINYCGGVCDPSVHVLCGGGLECISGTCLNPDMCMGCGQTCTTDADCPAEFNCTTQGICYNKSLCSQPDPAACGVICTGEIMCGPGLECYPTTGKICWSAYTAYGGTPCSGPNCGKACNSNSDCGSLYCVQGGYCGGTHSSVCNGCGAVCETNADCPGGFECTLIEVGTEHGEDHYCWNPDVCETPILSIPNIPEFIATEEIGPPPVDGPVDPPNVPPVVNPPPPGPASCGDGICQADETCAEDCECFDDGLCSEVERQIGSCRDCSANPGDLCGVPCGGGCEGGLECVNGVCWSGPICDPTGGENGGSDDGGEDKPRCSCECVEVGNSRRCTDTCTQAACEP